MLDILDRDYALFLKIAGVLNISKAADQLGLQQSGLSKSLARLEARLEKKLFLRKKTGLELTAYGASLRKSLTLMQDYWENHLRGAIAEDSQLQGLIRIGAHAAVAIETMPPVIAKVLVEFPGVEMEFRFARSPEINRSILNHELDLGFVVNPKPFADLVLKPIFRDRVNLFKSTIFKDDAVVSETVCYNPEMLQIDHFLSKVSGAKLLAIPNYSVIVATLKQAPCLGILPELVARSHPDLASLGHGFSPSQVCLVYRKERFAGAPRQRLLKAIQNAVTLP